MSTPTDPTAGEGLSAAEREAVDNLLRFDVLADDDQKVYATFATLLAARESAAATRARAEALREAAGRVREFRDWYPLSVFPSLDEVLADGYEPTTEQIAASSYRHAYGEVVPRNLRTWANEIEADALASDTAGESA